jgi:ABC-2 type transport system ATP-binding protein
VKEPAILASGLTRAFGALTAVDALDFSVAPGELFGLVGPDGAGKTTTLRMLAGVLRPSRGDAKVAGISVAREPERVKHRIAYMSQRFGLYTDLTIRENIQFYADLYRVPRRERPARIERLYRFSNLGPFEDRLAGKLSGGMKQKLSLCCALIHQPEVLLLDEPTFGVDPISRRDLWLILHEMTGQGVTVFVSTAYMDEAERCDHIALLDRGRVVALDQPERLQATLAGRVVAIRVSDSRRAMQVLTQAAGVRRAALFGELLHVTLGDRARDWPAARARLAEAGIDLLDMHEIEPTLEDVFMERVADGVTSAGPAERA